MGIAVGTVKAALKRPYLRHLLIAATLVSILSDAVTRDRSVLEMGYRGLLGAANAYANDHSEKVLPRDLYRVVEEERRLLGITAPVSVHLCTYYTECRKADGSYSMVYPGGTKAIYIQPHQLSRGLIAHELTHIAKDFPHLEGASPEQRGKHYLLIGEPRAALAGIRKTF